MILTLYTLKYQFFGRTLFIKLKVASVERILTFYVAVRFNGSMMRYSSASTPHKHTLHGSEGPIVAQLRSKTR